MIKLRHLNELIEKPISGEWGTESTGDGTLVLRTTNFTNIGKLQLDNVVKRTIPSKKIASKKLLKGDIIIEKSGGSPKQPVGRVVFFNEDELYLCNNFTSILRPKKEIVFPKYLLYQLFCNHCFGLTCGYQNKTTGIINLQLARYVKKLKIPLPPLPVQQKIATILDTADALKQKDKALIAKYDELCQSLFLDMFGDPVTNPKDWDVLSLKDMIKFLTSGSRGWAKYYSSSGDVFLRIQNVGKNKLSIDDVAYVIAPESAEAKRTKVEANDIILSITADLGRTGVIPENFPTAHINQHLAIIRLKKQYLPFYVSEYIASSGGQHQFQRLNKGGVKAGLNFTDIKSLNILNPPIDLQNQFAERIQAIEQQKQQAQASLQKSEDLFNCLLQKAFKGELVS